MYALVLSLLDDAVGKCIYDFATVQRKAFLVLLIVIGVVDLYGGGSV